MDPEADTESHPTSEPSPEIRELAREMDQRGWTGSPLVVHAGQVVGNLDRYEAARFLGMEDEVPTITLTELYEEAGMKMPEIASPEGEPGSRESFFQDYLRDLPRHIQEKYELRSN